MAGLLTKLSGALQGLFASQSEVDSGFYDDLEDALLQADVGLETTLKLVDNCRNQKPKTLNDAHQVLTQECEALLFSSKKDNALEISSDHITLLLVVGVNGAGKTTFIGKFANQCRKEGRSVVIGAGDTFRAAAEDQLAVWAQRAEVPLIRLNTMDPAAVMHETLNYAHTHGTDVIILDTAGRLQNQANLMAELAKISGVINEQAQKLSRPVVRENLLVLDATTGQNGLKQAEIFHQAVDVTGVVLTKLDGSAKGGIALAIADTYQLSIKAVGVGEGIDDLVPFDAKAYLEQLLPKPSLA